MAADLPDFAAARRHVLREVVRFVRVLRREGAAVQATAALPAVEALVRVGFDDRRRARAALAATLVTDPRDREILAEHFGEFWYRLRTGLEASATVSGTGDRGRDGDGGGERLDPGDAAAVLDPEDFDVETDPSGDDGAGDEGSDGDAEVLARQVAESSAVDDTDATTEARPGTYSASGPRTAVDGEGPAPGTQLDRTATRRLARALATLSGRRWSRARACGAVDARRALRESLDTGGVAVHLPHRERIPAALRACVLVDVSQSVVDAIDRRFLLTFLDELVAEGRSVRVFLFDTDIREVTDIFERAEGDPSAALAGAEVAWGGGTRIGASLSTLRREWPHAVGRRTVTLVVSDGLDVGEIEDLRQGITWLSGRSRAVVWLNPLAATAGYEPTCRGMATALPYVDGFFAFAGPADVTAVAEHLERHGLDGPAGGGHDVRPPGGV